MKPFDETFVLVDAVDEAEMEVKPSSGSPDTHIVMRVVDGRYESQIITVAQVCSLVAYLTRYLNHLGDKEVEELIRGANEAQEQVCLDELEAFARQQEKK